MGPGRREHWAHERGTLWTLDLAAPAVEPPPSPARVAWEEAGPASAGELAATMGLVDPSPVLGRMELGAQAFTGRLGGGIVCYGWVSHGTESIGELERRIRLGPGEAYVWDCYTLPDHRGLGLYKSLLAHMVGVLRGEGNERVWIGASLDNRPSIRGFEAAGFVEVLRVAYLRLGTRSCLLARAAPRSDPAIVGRARRALSRDDERPLGPLLVGRLRPPTPRSSTGPEAPQGGHLG